MDKVFHVMFKMLVYTIAIKHRGEKACAQRANRRDEHVRNGNAVMCIGLGFVFPYESPPNSGP